MLHRTCDAAWRTLNIRQFCLLFSRGADRLWLLCLSNTIYVSAPSLIALLAHAARYAWRSCKAELINRPREAERSL